MYLYFLIVYLIFAFANIHCGPPPLPQSVYDKIQQSASDPNLKCPFLRNSVLIEPRPSFLEECKNFIEERAITKIKYSNIDEALCVPFYNIFMRLCNLTNNITKEVGERLFDKGVLDAKLASYSNGNLSCEILGRNVDVENLTAGMASTFKLFSKEKCLRICSELENEFKPICSSIALIVNISKELENYKTVGSEKNGTMFTKVKPVITETSSNTLPGTSDGSKKGLNDASKTERLNLAEETRESSPDHDNNKELFVSTENGEHSANLSTRNMEHEPVLISSSTMSTKPNAGVERTSKKTNQEASPLSSKKSDVEKSPTDTSKSEIRPVQPAEQPPHQQGNGHGNAAPNGVQEIGVAADREGDLQGVAGDEVPGELHQDTKPKETGNDINEDDGLEEAMKNEDDDIINDFPPKLNHDQNIWSTTKNVENSKPLETEDGSAFAANYQNQNIDDSDSYFFSYFMMVCIMFICGYVAYHNKQKIVALVVEGRRGRRSSRTRRPNSANYRKLDSNLEEAVTSSCNKNATQVIY